MIDELLNDEAPFNLFLDRLAKIEFRVPDDHGAPNDPIVCARRIEAQPVVRHVEVDRVWLDTAEYFRFSRVLDLDDVNAAIEKSREAGRLGDNWKGWKTPPKASIVIPVRDDVEGRLYAFLPMSESAVAPLRGFVNAPFFADLNRRDMEPTVPLNTLFLDTVAQIAADMLLAVEQGEVELPDPAVAVALLAWRPSEIERLSGADWGASSPSRRGCPCGRWRTHIDLGWMALDARRSERRHLADVAGRARD